MTIIIKHAGTKYAGTNRSGVPGKQTPWLLLMLAAACVAPGAAAAGDQDPKQSDDQSGGFALEEPAESQAPNPQRLRELTEIRSEVDLGLGYVSDDSFKFGKYNGLQSEGLFGALNLDIRKRGAYDGADAHYWSLTGSRLGLRSRDLKLEYGEQGAYRLTVDYDQIPTFRLDTAQTIFDGAGSAGVNLTLPAGWVASGNTAGMTRLVSSLKDVDIEHQRRRIGAGWQMRLPRNWSFATHYRHEDKEGLKTVGAVIGNSGGNPRAVLLPEPVDYDTDQFDAAVQYADGRKQFEAGYYLSVFNDRNRSLTWQNPYSAIAGWDASAGYAAGGQGRLGLPPDNQSHQLSFAGGYDFSGATRATADLSLGRMTQDDTFLPYTVNPTLAASITQPLPRSSLDGRIDTTLIDLGISSRPAPKWRLNGHYRYDDRDNKTPRNEYVYIGGDSAVQNTTAASGNRRFNEPYSFKEHQLKFDLGYQVGMGASLSAGAERRETERTFTERDKGAENIFSLGLNRSLSEKLSGSLLLSRADRSGSTYRGEEPFISGSSAAAVAAAPGGWENLPDLRKYYLADRQRDKLALFATLTPAEQWNIGLNASYLSDDYDKSEVGLTGSTIASYTLDLSFVPSAALDTYAYYTYENLKSDQNGHSFSGGAVKLAQAADPTREWLAQHRDRADTLGLGFKHRAARFDLGADYAYTRSRGEVNVSVGSSLTAAPLPPSTTRLNSLGLNGTYKWKENRWIKLTYRLDRYASSNWAVDGLAPNTLANVITLGEDSPDYTVHVAVLSLAFRF